MAKRYEIVDRWTPEVIEAIDPSVSVTGPQWKKITKRLQEAEDPFDSETKSKIVREVLGGKLERGSAMSIP